MAFDRIKTWIKMYWPWIIAAFLFLGGTFFLNRFVQLFLSPDETANAFFAHAFAQTGSFRVFHAAAEMFGANVHPRSMLVNGADLVPIGFLGLPFFYGSIIRWLGGWSLTFLTPAIVVVTSYVWLQLLKRWVDEKTALIASVLFLLHPAVWYYSARGLMPNVLFVCCLILAAACLYTTAKFKQASFFAGIFLGAALFVRGVEIWWVLPLFAGMAWHAFIGLPKRVWAWLVFGALLPLGTMAVLTMETYGQWWVTGYSFGSPVGGGVAETTARIPSIWTTLFHRLFPFGIHPRAILRHSWNYGVGLLWWISIPSAIGAGLMLARKSLRPYATVVLVIGAAMCFWYGSWTINDNPDPTQITIANSYARYWLPAFVLATPLVSYVFVRLSARLRDVRLSAWGLVTCVVTMVFLNAHCVFFSGPDALIPMDAVLRRSTVIQQEVLSMVPTDGIIVTDRADKIFFPYRAVMGPLRNEGILDEFPKIVSSVPLFYYGITLPEKDFVFLNQTLLSSRGVRMEFIRSFDAESLYRLILLP